MKTRLLYTLLVVWCAFLVAPGVLVELGLFGRVDMNKNLPGGMAVLWVVGYLAQFAVFLWIMNIVPKQKMLWWFVASLLPWAVDWTQPVAPWFLLAGFAITIAVAVWIALAARRDDTLSQHGIRATGVVLEVLKPWMKMNVVINNVYIKRKVRLRIEREDGVPAYEGILNGLFMLGEIPAIGDRIPLRVDPAKAQRFEYDQDAGSASAAQEVPERKSAAGRGGIAGELERLANLRDRGALTASEFDAAKKKLLSR
jgi:putative oligomerization/nucleic acid binding protein